MQTIEKTGVTAPKCELSLCEDRIPVCRGREKLHSKSSVYEKRNKDQKKLTPQKRTHMYIYMKEKQRERMVSEITFFLESNTWNEKAQKTI